MRSCVHVLCLRLPKIMPSYSWFNTNDCQFGGGLYNVRQTITLTQMRHIIAKHRKEPLFRHQTRHSTEWYYATASQQWTRNEHIWQNTMEINRKKHTWYVATAAWLLHKFGISLIRSRTSPTPAAMACCTIFLQYKTNKRKHGTYIITPRKSLSQQHGQHHPDRIHLKRLLCRGKCLLSSIASEHARYGTGITAPALSSEL